MKRSTVRDDVATEVDLFKVLRARPLVITKGSALEIPQNTMMYGTGWLGFQGQSCAAVGSRVGAVMFRRAHLLPSLSVDGASLAAPSLRLRPPPHRTGQADFPHPAHREGVIHRG